MHIVTSPQPVAQGPRAPQVDAGHADRSRLALFVVDWRSHDAADLRQRLEPASEGVYVAGGWRWEAVNAHRSAAPSRLRMGWDYLLTAWRVWRQRYRVDRIVVWQPRIALLLACLPWGSRAAPWIVTSVLWHPRVGPGLDVPGRLRRILLALLLWRADGVTFFSEELAQQARQAWPRWAAKIHHRPRPVIPPLSGRTPMFDSAAPVAGRYLFAGGRSERDLDVVIEALAQGPWPVVLVCPAAYAWPTHVTPSTHIHLFREIDEARFGQWARGAAAVLVTLKDAQSPCGQLLIAEGLSQGVPVVATDAFGPRALIRPDQEGLLVPAGDAAALRRACEAVMTDEPLRDRLIACGRQRADALGLAGFLRAMAAWPLRPGSARSA